MVMKFSVLVLLLAVQLCLAVNRSNMVQEERTDVAPPPSAAWEMKNHHTIPRHSWDSSQDGDGVAFDDADKDGGTSTYNHD